MRLMNYLTINNIALLFIMLCAGYIYTLHSSVLEWNGDDILHLQIIKGSIWDTIKANYTNNTHPVGYFLYAKIFYCISNDYWFMRLSSVVPALISIPLFYKFIKKHIGDDYIALFASSLWAFNPVTISISHDIRQYTLLLMFCVIYLLTFLPKNKKEFYIHFITALCMIFTHYSSVILIFCGGIITCWHLYSQSLKKLSLYALSYGVIGTVFLIDLYLKKHFYLGFEADELFAKNIWLSYGYPSTGEIGNFIINMLMIMFEFTPFLGFIHSDISIIIFLWCAIIICTGLYSSFKNKKSDFYFYILIIMVMVLLAIFAMFPISYSRHTLFFLPIKLLIFSYGLKALLNRNIFLLFGTVILSIANLCFYTIIPPNYLTKKEFSSILSDIKKTTPTSETIFVTPMLLDHLHYQSNSADLCVTYKNINFCSYANPRHNETDYRPITFYGLKYYLEKIKQNYKSKNVCIFVAKYFNSFDNMVFYFDPIFQYDKGKFFEMVKDLTEKNIIYNIKSWYGTENKKELIGLIYTIKDIDVILEHPLFKQALVLENKHKEKFYYGYKPQRN